MSTSAKSLSIDPNKIYMNSFHWRNDSGELDVFEAARYFSGAGDQAREDLRRATGPGRRSLDVPIMIRSNPIPPDYHHIVDQKQPIKDQKKKFKQPSSPGSRIANFLNSLFNQASLKKKKLKPGGVKDFEEESPGGRRKRRSSISHFRIPTTKTAAADKGSGFRTPPPPYADTPTKSYKELARYADHHAVSLPVNGGGLKHSLLDKIRAEKNEAEKIVLNNVGNLRSWEKRELRKWSDEDDGGDSDSSSDLFDLPNHELDLFSSGLPVYETTHMERIRIGTQISSAT